MSQSRHQVQLWAYKQQQSISIFLAVKLLSERINESNVHIGLSHTKLYTVSFKQVLKYIQSTIEVVNHSSRRSYDLTENKPTRSPLEALSWEQSGIRSICAG